MHSIYVAVWSVLTLSSGASALVIPKDETVTTIEPRANSTAKALVSKRNGTEIEGESEFLLSYFFTRFMNGTTTSPHDSNVNTTLNTRETQCDGGDMVPIDTLPPCYRKCVLDNCCNFWAGPGPGDVRDMTVNDFCHKSSIKVFNWMWDHVAPCVKYECASCRPKCWEDSNVWMKNVCG